MGCFHVKAALFNLFTNIQMPANPAATFLFPFISFVVKMLLLLSNLILIKMLVFIKVPLKKIAAKLKWPKACNTSGSLN